VERITGYVSEIRGNGSRYSRVLATGAGVEREFSISGRVVAKQRNRLALKMIRDIMQYKRWLVKHGVIPKDNRLAWSKPEDEDVTENTEDEYIGDDEEDEG
jgi:hypothetical protein